MLSYVSREKNKLNLSRKAVLFGLSTLCAVSPTFGLENNSTQIKNSIVTQKEQNTDSTSATTLKKRKFPFNKPDARTLLELFGGVSLIITVPWLAYEKLVVKPELLNTNRIGAALAKAQVRVLYANHVPIEEYKEKLREILGINEITTCRDQDKKVELRLKLWETVMTLYPTGELDTVSELTNVLQAVNCYREVDVDVTKIEEAYYNYNYNQPQTWLKNLCDIVFADSATSDQKRQILNITEEMGFWKLTNANFIEWTKKQYELNF